MNITASKAVPTESCSKFHFNQSFFFPVLNLLEFCFVFLFFLNLFTLTLPLESVCSTQQLETASGLRTHHASNRCYADRISITVQQRSIPRYSVHLAVDSIFTGRFRDCIKIKQIMEPCSNSNVQ